MNLIEKFSLYQQMRLFYF